MPRSDLGKTYVNVRMVKTVRKSTIDIDGLRKLNKNGANGQDYRSLEDIEPYALFFLSVAAVNCFFITTSR